MTYSPRAASTGYWLRYFGLTREEAEALTAAIPEALADRMLKREDEFIWSNP